jgi:hypothetical protein
MSDQLLSYLFAAIPGVLSGIALIVLSGIARRARRIDDRLEALEKAVAVQAVQYADLFRRIGVSDAAGISDKAEAAADKRAADAKSIDRVVDAYRAKYYPNTHPPKADRSDHDITIH